MLFSGAPSDELVEEYWIARNRRDERVRQAVLRVIVLVEQISRAR